MESPQHGIPILRPMTNDERALVQSWLRRVSWLNSLLAWGCSLVWWIIIAGIGGGFIGIFSDIVMGGSGSIGAIVGLISGMVIIAVTLAISSYSSQPLRTFYEGYLKQGLVAEYHFSATDAIRIDEDVEDDEDIWPGFILQVDDHLLLCVSDLKLGNEFEGTESAPFPGREIALVLLPDGGPALSFTYSGEPLPLSGIRKFNPTKEWFTQDVELARGSLDQLDEILRHEA